MALGALVAVRPRGCRCRHHRPVSVLQRRVHLFPAELGRALGAGMAELAADLRVGLGVDEIDDALPRRLVLRRVQAGAARRDAAFRADAGHLDADQPGAALGALGVMHEVPVGRAAVDRAVLRHRRDDDAVLEPHVAQPERREHRPPHRVVAGAGQALEPGLRAFEPGLVAQPQILVADALRARQQRIVELHRIEMQIALDLLEPFQRIARRRLQPQHLGAARVLVFRERRLHGRLGVQILRQRDGALHRELGARADGEMRGGGGVAHQHDVVVRPALAQHAREIQPRRAADVRCVRHQLVAAEIFGENALAGPAALVLAHRAEAEFLPRRLRAFDDEGRGVGVELVGVRPDPAVLGLLEDEGEGVVEFLVGAEPDEFVLAGLDAGLEMRGEFVARPRIQPVGGDDQIVSLRQLCGARDFGLEAQIDAEFSRALL